MKKVLFSLMALAIALTACKKEEQIVPEIKADTPAAPAAAPTIEMTSATK